MLDGVAGSPTAQQPSITRTPRLSLDPDIRHLETRPIADRCGTSANWYSSSPKALPVQIEDSFRTR